MKICFHNCSRPPLRTKITTISKTKMFSLFTPVASTVLTLWLLKVENVTNTFLNDDDNQVENQQEEKRSV